MLITILNMVYKILAKAIRIRRHTIMSTIIHSAQTRFIRERSNLDNVYTFSESTALGAKSKQKLAIVMHDLRKLMTFVDWEFLQGA